MNFDSQFTSPLSDKPQVDVNLDHTIDIISELEQEKVKLKREWFTSSPLRKEQISRRYKWIKNQLLIHITKREQESIKGVGYMGGAIAPAGYKDRKSESARKADFDQWLEAKKKKYIKSGG